LNLDIGICLGFSALSLGFPLRGVSASCFASGFCSCLIHQAQLPNKLGNYIFKLRLVTTEKGDVIARPLSVIASEAKQSMSLKNIKEGGYEILHYLDWYAIIAGLVFEMD